MCAYSVASTRDWILCISPICLSSPVMLRRVLGMPSWPQHLQKHSDRMYPAEGMGLFISCTSSTEPQNTACFPQQPLEGAPATTPVTDGENWMTVSGCGLRRVTFLRPCELGFNTGAKSRLSTGTVGRTEFLDRQTRFSPATLETSPVLPMVGKHPNCVCHSIR